MRKKNLEFTLDNVMWFIIYTLPIILIIFSTRLESLSAIEQFIIDSDFANNAFASSYLYGILDSVVGDFGIFPLLSGAWGQFLMSYLCYFISMIIVHLFVDFVVFIPRLSHKWLNKLFGGN